MSIEAAVDAKGATMLRIAPALWCGECDNTATLLQRGVCVRTKLPLPSVNECGIPAPGQLYSLFEAAMGRQGLSEVFW